LGARSNAHSRAGASSATTAGVGASRIRVDGQRKPSAPISRRWIATARSNSISCSVIAATSASHGSGLRRTRNVTFERTAFPITGSSRKRS
jgi:hypothetical protein